MLCCPTNDEWNDEGGEEVLRWWTTFPRLNLRHGCGVCRDCQNKKTSSDLQTVGHVQIEDGESWPQDKSFYATNWSNISASFDHKFRWIIKLVLGNPINFRQNAHFRFKVPERRPQRSLHFMWFGFSSHWCKRMFTASANINNLDSAVVWCVFQVCVFGSEATLFFILVLYPQNMPYLMLLLYKKGVFWIWLHQPCNQVFLVSLSW